MALKRKRRAKKRSVRGRRSSWWPLSGYILFYLTIALIVTGGIAWGYRLLHTHQNFAVSQLTISHASPKTENDLRQSLGWVVGRNFFELDLAEVQQQAIKHPWVEGVNVHGRLPNHIQLRIREKQAAGLARLNNEVIAVSSDGKAISEFHEMGSALAPADPDGELLDFPVIVGIDGKKHPERAIRKGLNVLAQIRESSLLFWDYIETLDLSDEQNMIVHLSGEKAPIYLGSEVVPRNLRNYLSIAEYIQREYGELNYVELGFPNHVAIKPKTAN